MALFMTDSVNTVSRHPAPGKKPVVAHILEKLPPGGAEILVRRLTAGLAARNEFIPIVVGFEGGYLTDKIIGEGVKVELLGLSRRSVQSAPSFISSLVRIVSKLRHIFTREKVAVVHGHMVDAGMLSTAAARSLGIPSVITFHSTSLLPVERLSETAGLRRSARLTLLRHFSRIADANVAVSPEVKWALMKNLGWKPDYVSVITNGVPLPDGMDETARMKTRLLAREKIGLEKEAKIIFSAGRLVANKGHKHLVEAVGELRRRIPGILLVIAGDGPEQNNLANLAVSLGCGDSVRLAGFVPDPAPYYHAADLFALPSYWEGMPLALVEAMSYSLPVIASAVSGVDTVISDGRDGLLFPVKNHEAIAGAAAAILEDESFAGRLGRRAREKVTREYDLNRTLDRHVELYRSLIAGSAKSFWERKPRVEAGGPQGAGSGSPEVSQL